MNNQKNYYCNIPKEVNVPIELYQSLKGQYFIGFADNFKFGNDKSAWVRLYNPCQSTVNLYVNVWTATVLQVPYQAEFWFNADVSDKPTESTFVTPSNTTIFPLPKPKIKIQYASNVTDKPYDGAEAFVRIAQPGATLVESENGKLIFPPGGSFLIYLSALENTIDKVTGRVAFGWWEEKAENECIY